MAKSYTFSLFVVAILFCSFYVRDSEGVYGILTPQEGKRAFESESLNRKISTLEAIRAKLQRKEAFNAVISKMIRDQAAQINIDRPIPEELNNNN
ncbi:Hypothetical predicted protein [Paramuricea clavata]|uniref:Uncharacterized protein n=1 Tax=Paramuricea clavata TaxID=317549 RepID=A0A7D9HS81_PARCT|nr:Hypothetical predicted protein [Paramuricea clavata]